MSYIEDITEPLIKTLAHTGGLPAHQLAGHAANLEFWVGEVKHCFDVIDGYSQRFNNIKQGETDYAERQQQKGQRIARGHGSSRPINRGIKDQELKVLRRRLADVMYHVLARCCKEELVEDPALSHFGTELGLDVREIQRDKTKDTT